MLMCGGNYFSLIVGRFSLLFNCKPLYLIVKFRMQRELMVNMGRIVLPEAESELQELHNIMLTS